MNDEIIQHCLDLQRDLSDLLLRFVRANDLHLTLVPPWQMTDQTLVEEKIKQAIEQTQIFTLSLNKLDYGPNSRNPRLVWIESDTSDHLIRLKEHLFDAFDLDNRARFLPHVTIARFKHKNKFEFRPIKRQISLVMPVKSIELFESVHRDGIGYQVITSWPLKIPKS